VYLVLLRLADAAKVSEHLAGHRLWLEQGFNDNVFFLTGGIPAVGGGAILAAGLSRDELTVRLADDPFVINDVVTPEIIELDITMSDPRLVFLSA
jgi:uncharacterized protein YciI